MYSDNGGEYIALRSFLASSGITHLTSPPHTPEHNRVSEGKHRHIVETGLSLLTHAGMPRSYRTYAFATAVYLINRLPTPVLHMVTPFHKLFGTDPNYAKLRTFGCLCFPWLRPYNSNKLQNRSEPCVFIGYSLSQSAYLCLQTTTGRIYVSRHVKFDETKFPFKTQPPSPTEPDQPEPSSSHPQATRRPLVVTPLPCPGLPSLAPPPQENAERTSTVDTSGTTTSQPQVCNSTTTTEMPLAGTQPQPNVQIQ